MFLDYGSISLDKVLFARISSETRFEKKWQILFLSRKFVEHFFVSKL